MSYISRQLSQQQYRVNVILKIGDDYYGMYQPDWGITIDDDKLGLITALSVNPIQVDIRDVKTSISTLSFSLLDKDGTISEAIALDEYAWMNKEVKFYFGFNTGEYTWNSYRLLSTTRIRSVSKSANKYNFKCDDPAALLKSRIYTTETALNGALSDSATTITVDDTTSFDSSGRIKINDEYITYTGKTGTTFTGCTRGNLSSTADEHDDNTPVFKVTTVQDHAIDIAKDIILNQIGIDSSLVDSDSFDDIKNDQLSNDADFLFYMSDIENALEWLEDNILIATNTRLITDANGKLALKLLDQVTFAEDAAQFSEDYQIGNPSYSLDASKIVNKVIVKTDYNWGQQRYARSQEFTDSDSITQFGERELLLEFKGVKSAIDTSNLIPKDRANRLLLRLAVPKAEIATTTFLNQLETEAGDQVFFTNRFLPQPGSGSEFAGLLEVISKAPVNFTNNSQIKWKLVFTSYTGSRIALISPSPLITEVISQSSFRIPIADAKTLKVGYKLRLLNDTTREFYSDSAIAISQINSDIIVMASAFTTILTTSIRISFPDYDQSSEEQKSIYGYISPNTNIFASDSKKAYEIVL